MNPVDRALPSFLAGGLMGINTLCCPCPVCVGLTALFLANGVREAARGRSGKG